MASGIEHTVGLRRAMACVTGCRSRVDDRASWAVMCAAEATGNEDGEEPAGQAPAIRPDQTIRRPDRRSTPSFIRRRNSG